MNLIIYTDGGARGNPGPAGIGVVIYDAQKKLQGTYKKFLGIATNNQAEYQAVIFAMEKAQELKAQTIKFFLDSELVVRQLSGKYKIKNQGIAPLAQKVFALTNKFRNVTFSYVPRERNKLADKLVNEVIDEVTNKKTHPSGS